MPPKSLIDHDALPRYRRVGIAVLVLLTLSGCVRRRLTVRSNPPGAIVHVDNQAIGATPCSVDYVYYGTREIRLSLPGYETLTVNQPLPPPWYELPGIDFISENLVPKRIEDIRTVSFNLQRMRLEPPEQVIARGEELRRQVTPVGVAPILPASNTAPPIGVTLPPAAESSPAVLPEPTPAEALPSVAPTPPSVPGPPGFRY